jgi:hypothetical protein
MMKAAKYYVALVALLAASPSYAGPCARSISRVQARVDAVIDQRAEAGPWRPESLGALRGHQPTPQSLAKADEANDRGSGLQAALDALGRARDADRSADVARCNDELNEARRALGLLRH